jgi:SAM-dependent methyltransferase
VKVEIIHALLDLNRQFYQTFAESFSATRQRLQPGVQRILSELPPDARVLDLGCGNGELWRTLQQRDYVGGYVGIDFSPELLAIAAQQHNASGTEKIGETSPEFLIADLATLDWDDWLRTNLQENRAWPTDAQFDWVLAFAVLHHLPGVELRRQVLAKVRGLLPSGGRFTASVWQFQNSPRLRQRIQSWEIIGLNPSEVDPDDYLLDWRAGGSGLRYIHQFSSEELTELAGSAGFEVIEEFHSDGETGDLGMYQTWKAP